MRKANDRKMEGRKEGLNKLNNDNALWKLNLEKDKLRKRERLNNGHMKEPKKLIKENSGL